MDYSGILMNGVGDLDPIPINADTIAVDHLDRRQRQCVLYAFAGALVCDDAFGRPILDDLASYLQLKSSSPPWSDTLLPLLAADHCIAPFIDDLHIDEKPARARIVLLLLHFCLVRFKAYDARVRVALFRVADAMQVPRLWVCAEESLYIRLLLSEARDDANAPRKPHNKMARWAKVGAAAAVGAGLMVITGGLAAPAIGLGVSALGITSIGTFLGSAVGTAIVTGLFGVGGGGLASYKMHRRVGALSNFGFVPVCNDGSVHLTICISGILLTDFNDAKVVWRQLKPDVEQTWADIFCLEWETEALLEAGNAVSDFIGSQAGTFVLKEGLKQTVFNAMMAAVALPAAVMSAGYLIDNPWGVLISKADQAGDELGRVLLEGVHGHRPVSLIGFSAGARIILRALEFLAEHDVFGTVQDVYLLGCPGASSEWPAVRRIVAGRIVNAYTPGDWTLKYVYRAAAVSLSAFGLQAIDDATVENVDVTSIIRGKHTNYCRHLAQIIACLNLTGTQAIDPTLLIDTLSSEVEQHRDPDDI